MSNKEKFQEELKEIDKLNQEKKQLESELKIKKNF
jgi:hypothetical protein